MIPLKMPKRMALAHLPTPINKLNALFPKRDELKLFIKRDDYTGCEFSGNKIRKLEYILPEVMSENYDTLITCGGIQSNHCRATAAIAAQLGIKSHLLLKGNPPSDAQGNYFMDKIFGSEITFVTDVDYKTKRQGMMIDIQDDYARTGKKAYIIPEGASTGLGMFGYFNAFIEILNQEQEMGITFDTICVACGSSGTYAGLYLANELFESGKKIVGINIYDKTKEFDVQIKEIISDGLKNSGNEDLIKKIDDTKIHIIQGYVESGYGVSTRDELDFIRKFAMSEGIVLDPVYTGKGMNAVFSEIERMNPLLCGNVLFIHTGGLFGAFSKTDAFDF